MPESEPVTQVQFSGLCFTSGHFPIYRRLTQSYKGWEITLRCVLTTDLPVCPSAPLPQDTTLPSWHRRRVWSRPHAIWRSKQKLACFVDLKFTGRQKKGGQTKYYVHVYWATANGITVLLSNSVPSSYNLELKFFLGSWKIASLGKLSQVLDCVWDDWKIKIKIVVYMLNAILSCMLQFQ